MITLIITLIIFMLLIRYEIYESLRMERRGFSLPPMYVLRGLAWAACMWAYGYTFEPVRLEELIAFAIFLMAFYWTFFDGFRNLREGVNWFRWGETKVLDRFFGSGPGLSMSGHFLKWALMFGGFFSSLWLRIYL